MQERGEESSQDYYGGRSHDVSWAPGTQGEQKRVRRFQGRFLQEDVINRLPELSEYFEKKI